MNPLIRKLERFTRLSDADKCLLQQAATTRIVNYDSHQDIIAEGEEPTDVNLILGGWVCRYKQLADGGRQIMSFLMPGDLCDLNIFILKEMDHNVGAITAVTAAELGRDALERLTEEHPRITQALWWNELVTVAVQREWTLNVGQRSAYERIAHLMCEMFLRLRTVGLTRDESCDFPITQTDIGDATGLTSVHVNRTLKELRGEGLIELKGRRLTILDFPALRRAAMFNDNYLHLDQEGRHLDANG